GLARARGGGCAMMDAMRTLTFAKGHGTGNDFVIVPDPDGALDLTDVEVATLCDRRRGLGADGLLRGVRTRSASIGPTLAGEPEWFMDYRNADGSRAEMCGNGVRVYARYLVEAGLASGSEIPILTRAGRVLARIGDDIAVDMPVPEVLGPGVASVRGHD